MEQMPFTDIDKVFKRLDEVGRHLSLNKEENEQYEESLKAYRDTRNCFLTAIELGEKKGIEIGRAEGVKLGRAEGVKLGRAEGIEIGFAKGEAKGEAKGLFQAAQNLKSLGVHIETIMQATGLSREEIEAIPVINPHP